MTTKINKRIRLAFHIIMCIYIFLAQPVCTHVIPMPEMKNIDMEVFSSHHAKK